MAALLSHAWADLIAVDEVDSSYRRSFVAKRVWHVTDVSIGLNSLRHAPVMIEGPDVGF